MILYVLYNLGDKMVFKQKYTDDMVLKVFDKYNNILSLRQLSDSLGCSKLTADNIMKRMIIDGAVQKVNMGAKDKKNSWVYKRIELIIDA